MIGYLHGTHCCNNSFTTHFSLLSTSSTRNWICIVYHEVIKENINIIRNIHWLKTFFESKAAAILSSRSCGTFKTLEALISKSKKIILMDTKVVKSISNKCKQVRNQLHVNLNLFYFENLDLKIFRSSRGTYESGFNIQAF